MASAGQPSTTLLDVDRIVLPINHNNLHWTCAVIDIKNKEIVTYDSLHVRTTSNIIMEHHEIMEHLQWYIQDEAKERNKVLDTTAWGRRASIDAPQQTNGIDCGVFTIM